MSTNNNKYILQTFPPSNFSENKPQDIYYCLKKHVIISQLCYLMNCTYLFLYLGGWVEMDRRSHAWQWYYWLLEDLLLLSVPWRRQWHPTPVLLPGKSHGQRRLVGCSPWGCEELDMTKRLHFHFSLSCIGEGNDNPLQCSCLENPRDRGAW